MESDLDAPYKHPGANKVILVPYSPEWPKTAQKMCDDLARCLAGLDVRIEHIGSTAIPGLPAKPVIDLAILVAPQEHASLTQRLGAAGYAVGEDKGADGGHFFFIQDGERTYAHIHVVEVGHPMWDNWITFRDSLRADPKLRDQYAALKLQLAQEFADRRRYYTAAKEKFVLAVLGRDGVDL